MEKTNLEKTLMEELNALLEVDAAEAQKSQWQPEALLMNYKT